MKTVIEYRLKISPWLTVWTRPAETASRLKDTDWVWGGGLVPYVIMGVVGTLEASPYPTIIVDTSDTPLSVLILLVPFSLSLIAALVARMMWVNFIYYTGKIWNGTATKRGIDTVLSLSLMPQLLCASFKYNSKSRSTPRQRKFWRSIDLCDSKQQYHDHRLGARTAFPL
jgi:hypothetical protein